MTSQPICKGCGQPIYGKYLTALGATWHPEHFVCAACKQPVTDASFNTHNGLPYHAQCYLNAVAPRCAYCGRLVSPAQQAPGIRRGEAVRCPVCRSSAIETTSQAQPIFQRLMQWTNRQGSQYNN